MIVHNSRIISMAHRGEVKYQSFFVLPSNQIRNLLRAKTSNSCFTTFKVKIIGKSDFFILCSVIYIDEQKRQSGCNIFF